ncbi:MAG: hypothetical protein ACTS73_00960 [Arsenophonus sp. NEOnobi-MAG3]
MPSSVTVIICHSIVYRPVLAILKVKYLRSRRGDTNSNRICFNSLLLSA